MRYLIDLGHPAHLHFFRNVTLRLNREGHEILFTGREKDILVKLANEYFLEILVLGKAQKGIVKMGFEVFQHQAKIIELIRSFKPHAMLAIAGTFIAVPGFLTKTPTYVFYDTEHATISNLLSYPFATCIYVPKCYRGDIRWRHERYNGYHEQAYLNPDVFTPDPLVLQEAGLKDGQKFSILRFVNWEAAHDVGLKGISLDNKFKVVHELSKFGPVLISSEGNLPWELEPYRCKIPVSRMHHLLAYASLIFGESATMASEGALLGVPGIYIDPVGRGYTDQQEKEYGLVFNFHPERQNEAITKAVEILTNFDKNFWRAKQSRLLAEKINVNDLVYRIAIDLPYSRKQKPPAVKLKKKRW